MKIFYKNTVDYNSNMTKNIPQAKKNDYLGLTYDNFNNKMHVGIKGTARKMYEMPKACTKSQAFFRIHTASAKIYLLTIIDVAFESPTQTLSTHLLEL